MFYRYQISVHAICIYGYHNLFLFFVADKAERLLAEAASYGSQLVVFPEAFIGGYPRGSNFGVTIGNRTAKGKEEFRKYHAAAIDVPGKEHFSMGPIKIMAVQIFHEMLHEFPRSLFEENIICHSYISFVFYFILMWLDRG